MPPGEIRPQSPEGEVSRRDLRLLVVEDDVPLSTLIKRIFDSQKGLEKAFCDNRPEAVKLIEEANSRGKPFDVVITDKGLIGEPDGGFGVIEAANSREYKPYIVLLTGSAVKDAVGKVSGVMTNEGGLALDALKKMGINEVWGKPIGIGPFIDLVDVQKAELSELENPQA